MTVYWVVWDAAAHWVVDRLEREGALPAVTRMRARGTFAAARPARPNCQTPPSLATLFTGAWPGEHGVTGFTVPGAGDGLVSHVSGFAPRFPAVPPVWESASEHDRSSAFVHAPWVFRETGGTGHYVDAAVEAYSRRLTRHAVCPVVPGAGTQTWDLGPFRAEVEAAPQDGRVRVRTARTDLRLDVGGDWQPLLLDDAGHGTWVCCVRTPQGLLLVHTGVWDVRTAGRNTPLVQALAAGPPFAGEGVGPLYRAGVFGPRLAEGGDGTAEEVFLSSVRCVSRSFGAAADQVLRAHDADLVVVYLPMTDDIGHELLGWCDEKSAAHRPDIADQVWSCLRRCYQDADAVLGRVLDRAEDDDTVVLGADHGMVGSTHLVHVNDHLVRAGLTATDADGALDTHRSSVLYHPANNGSLWATDQADPVRAGSAVARAVATLRALTDPDTGQPVLSAVLDDRGNVLPEGAAFPPVVFLALADDYQPSSVLLGEGPAVRRTPKTGAHVVYTGDGRLHAVHAAVGPGIPAGGRPDVPDVIDNTAPARLVLRQLGVAPPWAE
ncbi:alkaline phosphatase family protein [Streptomyces albulus]|uniref:alkaline phosphatase family protein n=1 Tax=Streptomyces noursei TaxID=1971 RepID=UPI001F1EF517|nr:alkaline phosphatase family protein [Streptomyces noursei]MCE4942282.1 alkaline phosphatase family protein [Streptomyces noursei]